MLIVLHETLVSLFKFFDIIVNYLEIYDFTLPCFQSELLFLGHDWIVVTRSEQYTCLYCTEGLSSDQLCRDVAKYWQLCHSNSKL